jgi:hypothetical protein
MAREELLGEGTWQDQASRVKYSDKVIRVFIAICAAVILDSAPLLYTSPAVWDPESRCAARLFVRDPAVRIRRIIFPDRPWNIGWVSRRVAHEAGILTSSPHGVIDHPARSPHLRRPATVLGQYKYEIEVNRRLRRGHSLVWNNAISPPSGPAGRSAYQYATLAISLPRWLAWPCSMVTFISSWKRTGFSR